MELHEYGKITDREIQANCRLLYIATYFERGGSEVIVQTTDNIRVYFEKERFDHAFSRKNRSGTREFDYSRARRVLWIKKVIRNNCGGLPVKFKDINGHPKKRLYYQPNNEYLVILDWDTASSPPSLKFNTAYPITWPKRLKEIRELFEQ